jgi:hypothetical protein
MQTDGRMDGRTVGHDAVTVAFRSCFTSTHTTRHDCPLLRRSNLRLLILQNFSRQRT